MLDRERPNMRLKIFSTGGTLDKIYNSLYGTLAFDKTHLPEMLYISKSTLDIDLETIFLIDSLYMEISHRQKISQKCKDCLEDRIIITHGTDTMIETAKLLGTEINDKTIVLTGAMVPYSFGKTDALFNLGCAVAYVQTLPFGTYITMNGRYFKHDNVKKNKNTGEFETIK